MASDRFCGSVTRGVTDVMAAPFSADDAGVTAGFDVLADAVCCAREAGCVPAGWSDDLV